MKTLTDTLANAVTITLFRYNEYQEAVKQLAVHALIENDTSVFVDLVKYQEDYKVREVEG